MKNENFFCSRNNRKGNSKCFKNINYLKNKELKAYDVFTRRDNKMTRERNWILIDLQDIYNQKSKFLDLEQLIKQYIKKEALVRIYVPSFHTYNQIFKIPLPQHEKFYRRFKQKQGTTVDTDGNLSLRDKLSSIPLLKEKGNSVNLVIDLISLLHRGLINKTLIICGDSRKYTQIIREFIPYAKRGGKNNLGVIQINSKMSSPENLNITNRMEDQFNQYKTEYFNILRKNNLEFNEKNFRTRSFEKFFYTFSLKRTMSKEKIIPFIDFFNIFKIVQDRKQMSPYDFSRKYRSLHISKIMQFYNVIKSEKDYLKIISKNLDLRFNINEKYVFLGRGPESSKYINILNQLGFTLKTTPFSREFRLKEIGIDTLMAAYIINLAYAELYKNAPSRKFYIFSADADFLPVYQKLNDLGIKFKILAHSDDCSRIIKSQKQFTELITHLEYTFTPFDEYREYRRRKRDQDEKINFFQEFTK
jgi:hypothetical protein